MKSLTQCLTANPLTNESDKAYFDSIVKEQRADGKNDNDAAKTAIDALLKKLAKERKDLITRIDATGTTFQEEPSAPISETYKDEIKTVNTEPSDGQKEAGTYKKAPIRVEGMAISLENPKGSTRKGINEDGESWSNTMNDHYGYFKGTVGYDKDHVDTFINDDTGIEGRPVFVIDQINPGTGKFDEHKVMLGYKSKAEAEAAYNNNYDKGWKGLSATTELSLEDFKAWVYSDKPKKGALAKKSEQENLDDFLAGTTDRVPDPDKFNKEQKDKEQKTQENKTDDNMIRTGEKLKTISGRIITAPRIDATSSRKSVNTIKRINTWLKKEALTEVSGTPFQETIVNSIDVQNISPADQDTLNMFVWGDIQIGPNNRVTQEKEEPATKPPRGKKTKRRTTAEKEYDESKAALGQALLGLNAKKVVPDEQRATILRLLTDLMEKALKLGYIKFEENAKFILDDIRESFGKDVAGLLDEQMVQGAYISMASGRKGATSPTEVVGTKIDREGTTKPEDQVDANNFDGIKTNRDLRKLTKNGTDLELKQIQEEYETYLVQKARDIVAKGTDEKQTYDTLIELYQSQVNLDVRTADSKEMQAYSTPAPLAYIASLSAGIDTNTTVYEPTAGNGMLLLAADPKKTQANELDPDRAKALRSLGFTVTENNAVDYQPKRAAQAVIMNPPFGARQGESKIDQTITLDALDAMKPDGKATIIMGANRTPGFAVSERKFFKELFTDYNVTDIYEVSGKLYSRQGAAWPVRVITIDGRRTDGKKYTAPANENINRLESWGKIYARRNSNERTIGREITAGSLSDILGPQGDKPTGPGDKPAGQQDTTGTGGTGRRGSGSNTGTSGAGTKGAKGSRSGTGTSGGQRTGKPDDGGPSGKTQTGNENREDNVVKPGKRDTAPDADTTTNSSDFQSKYPVGSSGFNEEVVMPTNMVEAHKKAMVRLKKAVGGDIDQYLVDKLQYKSKKDMYEKLMGLQVDAVAAEIYNLEAKNGKGIIIADQTGVGKGRQAAAVIRYARLSGRTPVFVTVGGNLFSDMFSDMKAVGETETNPFIFNSKDADIIEVDKKGNTKTLITPITNKSKNNKPKTDAFAQLISTGELPEGMNAVFTTYSQFGYQPSATSLQRNALAAVKNPLFIMDEAHTAAGERTKLVKEDGDWVLQDKTAGFFSKVTMDKPTMYLSATWAKRADNTALYHRTDMMDAVDTPEDLISAIQVGGNPLQTVLATMLTESGQLFRRERSFEGISFNRETVTDNPEKQKKDFNNLAKGLKVINDADRWYQTMIMPLIEQLADEQGLGAINAGNAASTTLGIPNTFASVLHNYTTQFTMATKSDALLERVIESSTVPQAVVYEDGTKKKETQKIYIGLENTMESGIQTIADAHSLAPGDKFPFTFQDIMLTALRKTRMIALKDDDGNVTERVEIALDMIKKYDHNTWQAYKTAEETIESLDMVDIPVSPIDYVLQKLKDEGISTGEMTGRKLGLDYSGNIPVLKSFGKRDKNTTINKFNTGVVDVIIGNANTGFSIHASEKEEVTDKRMRHMYVVQAPKDINSLMQMLGRINRTGQVIKPEFTMLSMDVPSEQRAAVMTAKKMASLNATTTANEESDLSLDVPNFINKYGNGIANAYLLEHSDIARLTNTTSRLSEEFDLGKGIENDLISQLTGRLAVLDIDTQRSTLAELSANYTELINALTATGRNDLIVKDVDLQAKIVSSEVIHEGGGTSVFDSDSVLHKVEANWVGAFLEPDRVERALDRADPANVISLAAKDTKAADELDAKLKTALEIKTGDPKETPGVKTQAQKGEAAVKAYENTERYSEIKNDTISGIKSFMPGTKISLKDGELGVVVDMQYAHKGRGNPYAPSKVKLKVAVNQGVGMINVSLGYLQKMAVPMQRQNANLEDIFFKPMGTQTRYVATGNPLMGVTKLYRQGGRVVTFTDDKNKQHTGVLLPASIKKVTSSTFKVSDPAAVVKFLTDNPGAIIRTNDGLVSATMADGRLLIKLPSADNSPVVKKIKYDKGLRSVMGTQFAGKGATMRAVTQGNNEAVLDALMNLAALNIPTDKREQWEAAGGAKRKDATGSFDATDYSKITKQRRKPVEHEDFSFTGNSKPEGLTPADILTIIHKEYGKPMFGAATFKNLEIINDKDSKWRGKFNRRNGITLNAYYLSKADAIRILQHEKVHEYIKKDKGFKRAMEFVARKARNDPNSAAGKALEIAERRVPKDAPDRKRKIYEETIAYLIQYLKDPKVEGFAGVIEAIRSFMARFFRIRMQERDALRYLQGMVAAEAKRSRKQVRKPGQKLRKKSVPGDYSGLDDFNDVPKEIKRFTTDNIRHFMQDKFIELKRVQDSIGDLSEDSNAYLKETLYHGKTKSRIDEFESTRVEPLMAAINKSGMTLKQMGEYLHARHAAEANDVLRLRNPDRENNLSLSGMSNAEAALILEKYRNKPKLQEAVREVDKITRGRLKMLEDDGLVSKNELDAWKASYDHYIPLFREDMEDTLPSRGRGFSVAGKESHIRFGSERKVNHENVIPNILEASETTIVRGEKNAVSLAMYYMALNNPNSDLWTVDIMEPKNRLNKAGETVVTHVIPSQNDDHVVVVKIGGKPRWVKFNKKNPYAKRIASSIKNLDAREQNGIIRSLLKLNRFLAAVNTSYSPEFIISNLVRDIQTAGYNLSNTEANNMTKRMIVDTGKAMKGINHALRDKKGDNEWAQYFREFEAAGGRTGWSDPYADIDDRRTKIERKLASLSGAHKTRAMFDSIGKFVDDANTTVENSVRLAAFVHARKIPGVSIERAAQIAKELTVNFNRRGEWGVAMNALYLFYNASVQGSMRMIQGLRHRRTQKLAGATILFAIALDNLNRAMGGEDDDGTSYYDGIEDHIKDRNMIFMLPDTGGDYIKLPLPWGYNIFHVFGQEIGRAAASSFGHKLPYNTVDSAFRVLNAGLQAFNPVQDGSLLLTVTPTVLDPYVKSVSNTDWHGGPLRPEGSPYGRPKPDSQMYFAGATKTSRAVSDFLNSISGGDAVRPGDVDISPETLDMLYSTVTGAAGRVLFDAIDTPLRGFTGEEIEGRDIPMLRKVWGTSSDQGAKTTYYNRVNDVLLLADQIKYYRNDQAKVQKIRKKYSGEVKLLRAARAADKRLRALRRRKNILRKQGADKMVIDRVDKNMLDIMKDFNTRYNRIMY